MLHGIAARRLAVSGGTGPPGFRPLKTLLYSPEGGKREGLSFLEANALTGPPNFFGGPKGVGGSGEGGPPACPPWDFSHVGDSFRAIVVGCVEERKMCYLQNVEGHSVVVCFALGGHSSGSGADDMVRELQS